MDAIQVRLKCPSLTLSVFFFFLFFRVVGGWGEWGSSRWYRAGNRLSQSEYEIQGDEYTREAVAALRAVTNKDWSLVKKVQ